MHYLENFTVSLNEAQSQKEYRKGVFVWQYNDFESHTNALYASFI